MILEVIPNFPDVEDVEMIHLPECNVSHEFIIELLDDTYGEGCWFGYKILNGKKNE